MKSLSKIAALAAGLTAIALVAVSLTNASADSPGQLTGGSDVYLVKNMTQSGSYAGSINTACNDEVQYSVRLHNAAYGGLTNVIVSTNLVNGKMTAVPSEGASQGTSGSVSVSLPSSGSLAYESGTTVLYDSNGTVIKTLPDGVTTNGVNVGNIAGSTTEFVNLKAKIACPPSPPQVSFSCTALDVANVDRTHFNFTAHASVQNATVTSYVFTAKDANGNVVDTKTVTTNALSAMYAFAQDNAGTYTVTATVVTDHGSATNGCSKQVTVQPQTPQTPVFACNGLDVTVGSNRAITAKANVTASNGASLKDISFDFGDGTTPLLTTNTTANHTYAQDGTYNVVATVNFNVNDSVKSVTCSKQITVTTPTTPVTPPTTAPATTLPNTGPGDVAGLFVGTSAFGGAAHYMVSRRRRN